MTALPLTAEPVCFDGQRLVIEDITALASQARTARLSNAPEFRERIRRGADFLDRLLAEGPRSAKLFFAFTPLAGCHRPRECKRGMAYIVGEASTRKFFTRRHTLTQVESGLHEISQSYTAVQPCLCATCLTSFTDKYNEHRQRIWDSLPEMFGLEPWS